MIKYLLIVEDHPLCVTALKAAAHSFDSTIEVSSIARRAELENHLASTDCDAVLLDLRLPDGDGFEALAMIKARFSELPIAIVSANDSAENIQLAMRLGASGFVSKSAPLEAMSAAIAALLDGKTAFPAVIAVDGDGPHNREDLLRRLSPAQLKVVRELKRGYANKEIAFCLGLAEQTVKTHLSAVFKVLGLKNRSQAVLLLKADD